jgi:hypothetical protein
MTISHVKDTLESHHLLHFNSVYHPRHQPNHIIVVLVRERKLSRKDLMLLLVQLVEVYFRQMIGDLILISIFFIFLFIFLLTSFHGIVAQGHLRLIFLAFHLFDIIVVIRVKSSDIMLKLRVYFGELFALAYVKIIFSLAILN